MFAQTASGKWIALAADARQMIKLVESVAVPAVVYELHRCRPGRQLEIFSDTPGGEIIP